MILKTTFTEKRQPQTSAKYKNNSPSIKIPKVLNSLEYQHQDSLPAEEAKAPSTRRVFLTIKQRHSCESHNNGTSNPAPKFSDSNLLAAV